MGEAMVYSCQKSKMRENVPSQRNGSQLVARGTFRLKVAGHLGRISHKQIAPQ